MYMRHTIARKKGKVSSRHRQSRASPNPPEDQQLHTHIPPAPRTNQLSAKTTTPSSHDRGARPHTTSSTRAQNVRRSDRLCRTAHDLDHLVRHRTSAGGGVPAIAEDAESTDDEHYSHAADQDAADQDAAEDDDVDDEYAEEMEEPPTQTFDRRYDDAAEEEVSMEEGYESGESAEEEAYKLSDEAYINAHPEDYFIPINRGLYMRGLAISAPAQNTPAYDGLEDRGSEEDENPTFHSPETAFEIADVREDVSPVDNTTQRTPPALLYGGQAAVPGMKLARYDMGTAAQLVSTARVKNDRLSGKLRMRFEAVENVGVVETIQASISISQMHHGPPGGNPRRANIGLAVVQIVHKTRPGTGGGKKRWMTDLLREDEVGKKHRTAELYELCEGLQRIWTSNGKIRKREGLAYDDELGVEILVWVKTLRLWEEWESKGLGSMLLPMLHTMLRVHLGEGTKATMLLHPDKIAEDYDAVPKETRAAHQQRLLRFYRRNGYELRYEDGEGAFPQYMLLSRTLEQPTYGS